MGAARGAGHQDGAGYQAGRSGRIDEHLADHWEAAPGLVAGGDRQNLDRPAPRPHPRATRSPLRGTGATMMQQLKVPRDVINLCQNHVIGSKVDRVYLLDDYACVIITLC